MKFHCLVWGIFLILNCILILVYSKEDFFPKENCSVVNYTIGTQNESWVLKNGARVANFDSTSLYLQNFTIFPGCALSITTAQAKSVQVIVEDFNGSEVVQNSIPLWNPILALECTCGSCSTADELESYKKSSTCAILYETKNCRKEDFKGIKVVEAQTENDTTVNVPSLNVGSMVVKRNCIMEINPLDDELRRYASYGAYHDIFAKLGTLLRSYRCKCGRTENVK